MNERPDRGQVLVLFALSVTGLMAILALAIDIANANTSRRAMRTAADAAALAGAQDLQATGTRQVTVTERAAARADAIAAVENHFGATSTCSLAGNRSSCTLSGTPYTFSVTTPLASPPAAACATCDWERSVQVTVAHPTFPLYFARLFGETTWNVGATAIAGIEHGKAYTIVTLRPPSSATIPGVRNIRIGGGTVVNVDLGDAASNANMVYEGSGSRMVLDPGYDMFFYDPANPALWGASPSGVRNASLVPDPMYRIPTRGTSPPAGGVDSVNCAAFAAALTAGTYAPYVPMAGGAPDMTRITCYTPGVHGSLTVNNGTLAILEPGLYFFDGLLTVQGSLIGGYTPESEGVALVFRASQGVQFRGRTGGPAPILPQLISLNAGSRLGNAGGREASPARDFDGNLVQTNGSSPRLMTVIVERDARCPVVSPFPDGTCTNTVENQNKAVDLSGGSNLYLAGVQYGPTDNMSVAGGSEGIGYVGQVWSWTLRYEGGVAINQEGDPNLTEGILRLDAACTAPGTPCLP